MNDLTPESPPPPSRLLDWLLIGSGVVSALSIPALGWLAAARLWPAQVEMPGAAVRTAFIVLLSGAIGFGTNWLAIKMLFRPHRRIGWLLVWQQGLLPREQARLARAMGEVAAARLLNPEAILDVLSDDRFRKPLGEAVRSEIDALVADPATRRLIVESLVETLRSHGPEAIRRLRPEARAAIQRAIDQHLTAERVLEWIAGGVHRFAASREMRRTLARWIFAETAREGALTRIMRILEEQFHRYRERHPIRGFFAEQFMIDWDELRGSLVATLRSDEAVDELANLMIEAAESLTGRLGDPETAEIIESMRRELVERSLDWFERDGISALANRVGKLADEPTTWNLVEATLAEALDRLPESMTDPETGGLGLATRERLERLQHRLATVFPVAEIVERQVLAMDPSAVERMVDEVGRRELAWIQILGLVLGALAGGVLVLMLP